MNRRSFFATLAGAAAAAKVLALARIPTPPTPVVAAPAAPEVIKPADKASWLRWIRGVSLSHVSGPVTYCEWEGPGAPILYDAFKADAGVLDVSIKYSPVEIYNSWGEVVAMCYYDNEGWISATVRDSDFRRLSDIMRRLPLRFIFSNIPVLETLAFSP